jgi:hypothetical protein
MTNLFKKPKKKKSSDFLADELARGYKVTMVFFVTLICLMGLGFILFILPTII